MSERPLQPLPSARSLRSERIARVRLSARVRTTLVAAASRSAELQRPAARLYPVKYVLMCPRRKTQAILQGDHDPQC